MIVRRLYDRFLEEIRLYRDRNFILRLAGQSLVFIGVLHIYLQKGSLPAPLLLVGVLLFSVLFWRRTVGYTLAQRHLYMGTQAAIAGLMVFQEFIFAYLFLVLVGQSVLMFGVRSGLIWAVTLYLIALAANWLHPGDGLLAPAIRTLLVTAGVVITGAMGSSMARARRTQDRVQNLLAELSEAYEQLQALAVQSRRLAVAHERDRLARELHGVLGQRLTASIVQLEGASRLMEEEPRRAAGMVETARAQLGTGLEELRKTFEELRQSDQLDAAPVEETEAGLGVDSEER